MSSVLVLNDEIEAAIAKVIADAAKHPTPVSVAAKHGLSTKRTAFTLEDTAGKPQLEIETIVIPMGFRCAYSQEEQLIGMCHHLSVSVERAGMLPNPIAFMAIAQAFGFRVEPGDCHLWQEEFTPGQFCINIVEPLEPKGGSHGRAGQASN